MAGFHDQSFVTCQNDRQLSTPHLTNQLIAGILMLQIEQDFLWSMTALLLTSEVRASTLSGRVQDDFKVMGFHSTA